MIFKKLKKGGGEFSDSKHVKGNPQGPSHPLIPNFKPNLEFVFIFLYQFLAGHSMKVRCLTFLDSTGSASKLLSGSDDKTVKLYSLSETRAQLVRIFCGHKGIVRGLVVCQASEGQRFASCGTDNCVIVWETNTGDKLHVFQGCAGMTNDVVVEGRENGGGRDRKNVFLTV